VWEVAECKFRSVNFSRDSDTRRAFRLAFRVTGICDALNGGTIGAVVIGLGAPATVTQPMRDCRTISERCLGPYWCSLKRRQELSEILWMYMSNKNTPHIWCIDYCSLSTSKLYYGTQHLIQHSDVCIATLRRTKDNSESLKNGSRYNWRNNPTKRSNDINRT